MLALLWIHGRTCRVLVKDSEGCVIDCDDSWNNRASAECAVLSAYPQARIKFCGKTADRMALDAEWNTCVLGG